MISTIYKLIKYYFFWILYMLFFKCVFLAYNISIFSDLEGADLWGIFRHGYVMDLSAAAYFTAIPALILALGFFKPNKIAPAIIKYYTLLVLIFATLLAIADMGLYVEWGTRINAQFLMYLGNPGGMYASLTWWQLIAIPVMCFIVVLVFFRTYNKWFPKAEMNRLQVKLWQSPIMLFLAAALIIPIRGGLDRAPLNHSSVYFSTNSDANHAAYNYFWNFMYSVLKAKDKSATVHYMEDSQAKTILEDAQQANMQIPVKKLISLPNGKACNVVFVMLESFSNKIIEPLGGLKGITPNLNALCNEGIMFTNFIATGGRSDKGMQSLVGARPSDMNRRTWLAFPDKLTKLNYMPKYFADHGYDMSFYYGGDVNFYNTRAVMIASGVDKIISKSDFPTDIGLIQKWGVPDEYLYARLFDDLSQKEEPFFSMVYNISSHPPYDLPHNYERIKVTDEESAYLNSTSYSDSCLGVFINQLKASDMWDNTLLVISADHASRLPGLSDGASRERYAIPLILSGGVVKGHRVIDNYGNGSDLAALLVKQLGWEYKESLLTKNFLTDNSYAFYFTNNGWGFQSDSAAWFEDLETKRTSYFRGENTQQIDSIRNFAKAYVQYLHNNQ